MTDYRKTLPEKEGPFSELSVSDFRKCPGAAVIIEVIPSVLLSALAFSHVQEASKQGLLQNTYPGETSPLIS